MLNLDNKSPSRYIGRLVVEGQGSDQLHQLHFSTQSSVSVNYVSNCPV
jgi:hypothetical protein